MAAPSLPWALRLLRIATIVNTNMAAAAGVVAAVILDQIIYKKLDLTIGLNGALGGGLSLLTRFLRVWHCGADRRVGGCLIVIAVPLLDKLKIDDVVGNPGPPDLRHLGYHRGGSVKWRRRLWYSDHRYRLHWCLCSDHKVCGVY